MCLCVCALVCVCGCVLVCMSVDVGMCACLSSRETGGVVGWENPLL